MVPSQKTAPTTSVPASTPVSPPTSTSKDAEPAARFKNDGVTTAAQTTSIATSTGGPIKGGVLAFRLASKSTPLLKSGPEILAMAGNNPAMTALLTVRARCPLQYAPHVEVVRADGGVVRGAVKGVNDAGQVVVDAGFGKHHTIAMDEPLQTVRHQMDTDGDIHTALVTVFDAASVVRDPWALSAFAGKTLTIETFDAEHPSLAVAAKKGDVSGSALTIAGTSPEGISLKGGGSLLREHWNIASIALEQPAYSYKRDGMRLGDVGAALAPGTTVAVTLPGGRTLSGTFLGTATDAEGSDHVVVEQGNGIRQALRDVVDVTADATTRTLWRHPDYSAVYG